MNKLFEPLVCPQASQLNKNYGYFSMENFQTLGITNIATIKAS